MDYSLLNARRWHKERKYHGGGVKLWLIRERGREIEKCDDKRGDYIRITAAAAAGEKEEIDDEEEKEDEDENGGEEDGRAHARTHISRILDCPHSAVGRLI